MSPRRRLLILLLLVGLMMAIAAAMWPRDPEEPIFRGKPLSEWLYHHVPSSAAIPDYNSPGWREADLALRAIGSNAVPTLLRMISARKPSPFEDKLKEIGRRLRLVRQPYRHYTWENEEAAYAFEVLGTNGWRGVPGLIRIYEQNISPSSQECAAKALGEIGPPAITAAPILLKDFSHTNSGVRRAALSAMIRIRGDPATAVPALIKLLRDPIIGIRWNAMVALSEHHGHARPAVPELLEALKDPGMIGTYPIRQQAETALWRIAPEKIAPTVLVGSAASMLTNGVTTQALDVLFDRQRHSFVKAGTATPCVRQFYNSEPRAPLSLYLRAETTPITDQFLGRFEVLGIPEGSANISTLCVIADGRIVLCARDNRTEKFLELRRVD